eukprot:15339884-Alexandrium_andersonii.AAC.1
MSASLVGSEMCIRDSPNPPQGCEVEALLAAGLKQALGEASRGGPELPVSYTHLTLPTICSV